MVVVVNVPDLVEVKVVVPLVVVIKKLVVGEVVVKVVVPLVVLVS